MEIRLKLPDEFASHYSSDHFADSIARIRGDLDYYRHSGGLLSGRYEFELLEALADSFSKAG